MEVVGPILEPRVVLDAWRIILDPIPAILTGILEPTGFRPLLRFARIRKTFYAIGVVLSLRCTLDRMQ